MNKILGQPALVKLPVADLQLPVADLQSEMETFLHPLIARMPDKRLGRVLALAMQGICSGQSPVITDARYYRDSAWRRFATQDSLAGGEASVSVPL